MRDESAAARRWARGFRAVARAAAFLTVATGVNGLISDFQPRYEPIYLNLAAVAVIAWAGGLLLGVSAAIAAVVCYDWMFSPIGGLPSMSTAVPLVAAIGAAAVTQLGRVPLRRRTIAPSPPPRLLAAPAVPAPDPAAEQAAQTIARLTAQLKEARDAVESEIRRRVAQNEAARARDAEGERELDAVRQELDLAWRKVDEERQAASDRLRQAEARIAELQVQNELTATEAGQRVRDLLRRNAEIREQAERAAAGAGEKLRDADALVRQLEQRAMNAEKNAAEEKSRADREAAMRVQIARDGLQRLEQTVADLRVRNDAAIDEGRQRVAVLQQEVASLQQLIAQERERAAAAAAREAAMRAQITREGEQRLEQTVANLRAKNDAALEEGRQRIAGLQREVESLQQLAAEERERAAAAEASRARAVADADANLQRIVAGLTTDHENAIGEAMVEKESARAEVRRLTKQLTELQAKLQDLDSLRAEVIRTTAEIRKQAAAERAQLEADWNAKLETIVAHLAEDHEADVGKAVMEREEARAELRSLTMKLHKVQEQHEAERQKWRAQLHDAAPAAKILLAQADGAERAALQQTLERRGYQVIATGDGLEALRLVATQKPDVVVTDAVLPRMNGRELVQFLKSRAETSRIRIVMLNGAPATGTDFRADEYVASAAEISAKVAALLS